MGRSKFTFRSPRVCRMSQSSPGLQRLRGRGVRRIASLAWLCLAGLFVWLFAEALFCDRNFVFRDAAHFYHPLFKLIQEQWSAGLTPLWNPYENAGSPLLAWAVSSVFYPGKLIFALPVSYDTAFKTYTLAHVALAAFGAWRLARYYGASPAAAGLAAEAYAFGGSVLFQYCNVVFLVSAAWAPLAVWQADRMLRQRRCGAAAAFGLTLAMMTLGGDPQMAYLMVLLSAGYAWLLRREERQAMRRAPGEECDAAAQLRRPQGVLRHRLALLIVAAFVGLGLSAVQVLPSLELTRRSARAIGVSPRSLYELPAHFMRERDQAADAASWYQGLLAKPSADDTHLAQLYSFSIGPWRWAEFFWPNVGGRQFPTHRRWFHSIPAEGRVWVPSLYLGLAPLVFAIACWSLRSGDVRLRWLSWIALLSLLGALGVYGLSWLVREVASNWSPAARSPATWPVGDGCGGLYWLATVAAPGFVNFRYPAKLLTLTSLAVALLAARGWDSANEKRYARRVSRLLLALIGVSLIGGLAALAIRPLWAQWMQAVPADSLFGPFQAEASWWDLFTAFAQTTCVATALWAVWRRRLGWPLAAPALALLVTAVDLGLANGWMIVTAPAELWHTKSATAELLRRDSESRPDAESRPVRLFRADRPLMWMRPTWRRAASPHRQQQGLIWDRQTLWPKYNLDASVALLQTPGTFDLYDYRVFLARLRRSGGKQPSPYSASGLDSLNVRYSILPRYHPPPDERPVWRPLDWPTPQVAVPDTRVWLNTAAGPRAWIVRQVEVLPPLTSRNPRSVAERTDAVLFSRGKPRDLQTSACVEARREDLPPALRNRQPREQPPAGDSAPETCRVIRYDSRRVQIEVNLQRPGLLVLCDTFYPGWRAAVRGAGEAKSRPAPILPTNRVMRGVWIPQGRHTVTFSYQPASFTWGAGISAVCWCGLAAVALVYTIRRRRRPPADET